MQYYLGRIRRSGVMRGEAVVRIRAEGVLFAPGTLKTAYHADCPASFAESADGILLIANGIDPMLRWDGIDHAAIPAGVQPPNAAPIMQSDNAGSSTNESNSPYEVVNFDFTKYGWKINAASREVRQAEYNRYAERIRATYPNWITQAIYRMYFLNGGVTVGTPNYPPNSMLSYNPYWVAMKFSIRLLRNASATQSAASINGRYVAFQRFKDKWGNLSDPSPLTADVLFTDATKVIYTQVDTSIEPRVTQGGWRQLWRSTAGQAQVFFLDIETQDMEATEFTSTKTDAELSLCESEAAFGSEYEPLLWRHGVPPSNKPYVVSHQNRMVAAGDRPYREGMAGVTYGSATVTGYGTAWQRNLAGRFFHTHDNTTPIEILSVDSPTQLTLASPYLWITDAFQPYAIRAGAERNLIYWTEVGLCESWPATNAISLNEDNDEVTGLLSFRGYCHVLKRKSIFRLAFDDLGGIPEAYPVLDRGCVNQQCAVAVEGVCWMLDEQGVHAFDGSNTRPASEAIQDIFRPEDAGYRINWAHACRFHAVLCPGQHLIRWFVCLSGHERPRHALCLNYRLLRWWVEEYPTAITSSVLATVGDRLRPMVGTGDGKICTLDTGALDLLGEGTNRFTPLSVTLTTITAPAAAELPTTIVGAPVAITQGRGKGQWRRVASVSGNTITLDQPWRILPAISTADDASTIQLGGMPWRWKSAAHTFVEAARSNPRGIAIHWKPQETEGTMDLRLYEYGNADPTNAGVAFTQDGVTMKAGEPDHRVDLTIPKAALKYKRKDWEDQGVAVQAQVEVELRGFAGESRTSLRRLILQGCVPKQGEGS